MTKRETLVENNSLPPIRKDTQVSDPLTFDAIERAVNDAAKRVNATWLALISLMAYVLIATGKITHKDLFLETPVKLPVLSVDVPLRGYFVVVPAFVLALHFYFCVQLTGLWEKFREYEALLLELGVDQTRDDRLRQRLDNSLFAKVIGGVRARLRAVLRIIAWISVVIAPIWLILFVQLAYLPEQDGLVTNWHRIALLTGGALALYTVPFILRKTPPFINRALSEPFVPWLVRFAKNSGLPDFLVCAFALATAFWISFFVAIFPWEQSPFYTITKDWLMAPQDMVTLGPAKWFTNRLVLSDQNLVEGFDLEKVTVTRALRKRSFVAAIFDRSDLRQVDFTGSDLSHASLSGAKLQKAQLGCAYSYSSAKEVGLGGCTDLRGVNLKQADLSQANLDGAILYGARLDGANIRSASLYDTHLQGANLSSASLDYSDLSFIGLDGALLRDASLIAASLYSARLRGTNFFGATLYGAQLDYALAQNSLFAGAELQGASMKQVNFEGALFLGTAVYGTDISNSDFSGATIGNLLTNARWREDFGYSYYTPDPTDDPFGKKSDKRQLGTDYTYSDNSPDPRSPKYFENYTAITQSAVDAMIKAASDKRAPNTNIDISSRLSRLKPGAPDADWSKLLASSGPKTSYVKGLADRLLTIACAKAGDVSVVRGLLSNNMLCPFHDEINLILRTGNKPDGSRCENKNSISETEYLWESCQAPQ